MYYDIRMNVLIDLFVKKGKNFFINFYYEKSLFF